MKENIKIGLLGVIAVCVVMNTFMKDDNETSSRRKRSDTITTPAPQPPVQTPPPGQAPPANPVQAMTPTSMTFQKMEHDFGSVNQDTENVYAFEFTNTGSEPLLISAAKGSCGCTNPDYPKQPIAPGASSKITVTYKPGKQQGSQSKSVTLTANTEPATTVLQIKAEVQKI